MSGEGLRDGVRTVLAGDLNDASAVLNSAGAVLNVHVEAEKLENAIQAHASCGHSYIGTFKDVRRSLRLQTGPFPDDIVGIRYLKGELSAPEVVGMSSGRVPEVSPREIILRMFVKMLIKTSDVLARERARALEIARAIETSCYNASIRESKRSEEPPRRQWDSPAFVDIYSTRAGLIKGYLDPDSSTNRAYGCSLVPRILAYYAIGAAEGTNSETRKDSAEASPINPGDLGFLPERVLCPSATEKERLEIAKRSEQKVVEKESTLFRCPSCGLRRCTYQEVQRRSLDEAPDYQCYCLNCKWRFIGRS